MENVLLMGVVHGPSQGLDQGGGLAGRQGCAVEAVGQTAAVDELEGEEGQAVLLADLVDLHDVGMLQAGHRLGLGLEAGQGVGAGVVGGEHHFEGDHTAQAGVAGLVDDAHAAAPQLTEDLVTGNAEADRGGGGLRC